MSTRHTTNGRLKYTAEQHANAMLFLREADRATQRGDLPQRLKDLENAIKYARRWADSIESSITQLPKGFKAQETKR